MDILIVIICMSMIYFGIGQIISVHTRSNVIQNCMETKKVEVREYYDDQPTYKRSIRDYPDWEFRGTGKIGFYKVAGYKETQVLNRKKAHQSLTLITLFWFFYAPYLMNRIATDKVLDQHDPEKIAERERYIEGLEKKLGIGDK